MKRIFLGLALFFGFVAAANAQTNPCVGIGGVNNAPPPGYICQSEPAVPSYGATSIALVPASSATDVACITGSTTKVTRIQYIRISSSSGTLVNAPVFITKHATANTGGTAATSTALPVPYALDSANPAAVATTTAYTANPTITDSTPGILDHDIIAAVTTGTASTNGAVVFDYTARNYVEAPTLRSAAQQICVNLNGLSISTGLMNITFRWTEFAQ
jgi:hypothetical protein